MKGKEKLFDGLKPMTPGFFDHWWTKINLLTRVMQNLSGLLPTQKFTLQG